MHLTNNSDLHSYGHLSLLSEDDNKNILITSMHIH